MRGARDVCLLCRHAFKPRAAFTASRRSASTRNEEPYVLPRLVIDLDAADSEFVRRYEDMVKDQEKENAEASVQQEATGIFRVPTLDKTSRGRRKLQQVRPKVALKTFNVIPPDLLSYSLLGEQTVSKDGTVAYFGKLLNFKMIQPEDSVKTNLHILTDEFTVDADENLRRAGFIQKHKLAIAQELENCEHFSRLHRMVAMLSSTVEGCSFLAEYGSFLVRGIRNCRKAQGPKSYMRERESVSITMVLHLLNNLHRSSSSKGVEILGPLCNAGLYYAASAFSLPATKMYLELARRKGYQTDWRTAAALRVLSRAIKFSHNPVIGEIRQTNEALELITGWGDGGNPLDAQRRTLCFSYLLPQDTNKSFLGSLYPEYIASLGELGLNGALLAEYHHSPKFQIPELFQGDHNLRFRAHLYATAFLLANNSKHALSVLQSIPRGHQDDFSLDERDPPQHWHPTRKDTLDPLSPPSRKAWMLMVILRHYSFNKFRPTNELWDVVWDTLQNLPEDPQQALNALESILVTDSGWETNSHSYVLPPNKILSLDWAEIDGKEGLVAVPLQGKRIVYRKPARKDSELAPP
jgi:hypothetical protein